MSRRRAVTGFGYIQRQSEFHLVAVAAAISCGRGCDTAGRILCSYYPMADRREANTGITTPAPEPDTRSAVAAQPSRP
jgi:hypothetical protein